MKHNLPVTTQHVEIAANVSLVSKTNLKGIITYANEAFIEVSGFALEELVGSSHNIVRHPDMPSEIFAAMWKTLQNGKPWQGIIKNRCKSGDFYWVNACIVPIRRNGQTIGYMSVRKQATADDIAAAERLHVTMVRTGKPIAPPCRLPAWLGIRFGIRAGTVFVSLMMLIGGALGIGGLYLADAAFTRMYQQQFEPVITIGQIEARLQSLRGQMMEAQLAPDAPTTPTAASDSVQLILSHYADINDLLQQLPSSATSSSSANAALFQALQQYLLQGQSLVEHEAINPASQGAMPPHTRQQLLDVERKASLTVQALRQALADEAQQGLAATLARNEGIRTLAIAGIALGLLAVILVGHLFICGVVNPLNASIHRMNRIAEGNLQDEIDLSGSGETAQLNQAATVMQLHLKVMLDEIALAARRIHRHCKTLHQTLYEVTEHSEAQHDQVYTALRALDTAITETSNLSARAERLHTLSNQHSSGDLATETLELATATRLTAFGAEEVADAMRQVAALIVQNRGEAQLAWQASEALIQTARELNNLVDFFKPLEKQAGT